MPKLNQVDPEQVFPSEVMALLQTLCKAHMEQIARVLDERKAQRMRLAEGRVERLEETAHVRSGAWMIDPLPASLAERRVELILGHDRHGLVDGLNSGAKTCILDLDGMVSDAAVEAALVTLGKGCHGQLGYIDAEIGRVRARHAGAVRLAVAPRTMDRPSSGFTWGQRPVAAPLVDLAMFMAGLGRYLLERQDAILLHVRGIHGHFEARVWNAVLDTLEEHFELPTGSIRATVAIDSIGGTLEAEEILFELLHHTSGLAIDAQGYTADHIDLFSAEDRPVMPAREHIALNAHYLRALSMHLVGIGHRRGAHVLGTTSYALPATDAENDLLAQARTDKEREALDGHDGTLVAHPGLVNLAMVEFNRFMPLAHQLDYQRRDQIAVADLVRRPKGSIGLEALRSLVRVVLFAERDRDLGTRIVLDGRIHDASSVRLARALLHQWMNGREGRITGTGLAIDTGLVRYLGLKEGRRLFGAGDARIAPAVDRLLRMAGNARPLAA